jgi:hypothetical protein
MPTALDPVRCPQFDADWVNVQLSNPLPCSVVYEPITMTRETLELVNQLLDPKRMSYIQEIVLTQTLAGKRYREIAAESGYDLDYVKEVGAQLWSLLSGILGEKVTKKNIQSILDSYRQLGEFSTSQSQVRRNLSANPSPMLADSNLPEIPSHAVPLNSKFYIERPPIEARVNAEIARPGSLVRIKAPRQMGKSSLLVRSLAHSRQELGYQTVTLNLQRAERRVFGDLSRFLRWVCTYVTRELHMESRVAAYWDEEIGSKVSCTSYFQNYLLPALEKPLVLALDEVNRIFEYPDLAQEFFPLLRTWHEEAAEVEMWSRLRLILAHSTEAYLPLKVSQSPFNVGLPIQLPELTRSQISALAQRYPFNQQQLQTLDLDGLMGLVGGHPYLIRLMFHQVHQGYQPFAQLLSEAPTQAGIYSAHLRRYWVMVQSQPELMTAIATLTAQTQIQLAATTAHQLESMGLIKLAGNVAVFSCELYRLYFQSQLAES